MALGLLTGCARSASTVDAYITVDPGEEYQTVTGWEVTARTWEYNKHEDRFDDSWEENADRIFSELVERGGINRIRLALKSGFENPRDYWADFSRGLIGYHEYKSRFYEKINDNNDPLVINADGFHFSALDYVVERMVLPLQQKLASRGERLVINLCYQDFRHSDATSRLVHATDPQEYAEFVVAAFEHLRAKYNIVPDYFEVILEPDNTANWTGQRIGEGLVEVSKRLAVAGFTPDFIAPGTSRLVLVPQYFDDMIAVPGVADVLDVLAYHRYATDKLPRWVERYFLQAIRSRADKFGLRTAMLEYLHGDIDDLIDDLTIANVSSWQMWGIASRLQQRNKPDNVMLLVGEESAVNPGQVPVQLTENASLLAPVFRAVREGAVRVAAESDHRELRPIAFRLPSGVFAVHIYIRQPISGKLLLRGLPPGQYRVEVAGRGDDRENTGLYTLVGNEALAISAASEGVISVLGIRGPVKP